MKCVYIHVHVCALYVSLSLQCNMRHGEVVPHTEFYVPAVSQVVDFVVDFFNWMEAKVGDRIPRVYHHVYIHDAAHFS